MEAKKAKLRGTEYSAGYQGLEREDMGRHHQRMQTFSYKVNKFGDLMWAIGNSAVTCVWILLRENESESCSVVSNSFETPWAIQSMEFSRPEYWSGLSCPPPGDLPNPGIEPRSPTLWAGSLPAESQGKPKNTGVGSLSLLQQIFPTQESNQSLLHCGRILYQLSYEGSSES